MVKKTQQAHTKRQPGIDPKKLAKFLEHLMQSGNVRDASRRTKIAFKTVYTHRKSNPAFKEAFDEAMEIAVENLEGEGFRRAMEGVLEPVYQGGKRCGVVRKYSDTLLIFLLKGRKKAIYGDTLKHSGDPDAPITFDDLGREGAVEAIATILAGAGIKANVFGGEGSGSGATDVAPAARPADRRTK